MKSILMGEIFIGQEELKKDKMRFSVYQSNDGFNFMPINSQLVSIVADDDYYIFHASTLKLFKTDNKTQKIIESYVGEASRYPDDLNCKYSEEIINTSLEKLKSAGLFDRESEDQLSIDKTIYYEQTPSVKCLTLNLAHTCNLKCIYCFASQGSYKENNIPLLMSKEVAFRAVDLYLDDEQNNNEQEAIDFFGGEPLLNFKVLRDVVLYAEAKTEGRKRRLSFNLTTNGTLLTKRVFDFLKRHNVRIMVSIDGEEEIHDALRKTINFKGSYQNIIQKVKPCLAERPDLLSARATITPMYLNIPRIDEHFNSLGFEKYGFELMYSGFGEFSESWTNKLIEEYDCFYGNYASNILDYILCGNTKGRGLEFIFSRLRRIRNREKIPFPCRMSREAFAVTPNGDLYPCHWLAGNDQFIVGSVYNNVDPKKRKDFFPRLVFEKEQCRSCWARYLCGGVCPAISFMKEGDDKNPDKWLCQDRLIMWKWMLWLYIKLLADKPAIIVQL